MFTKKAGSPAAPLWAWAAVIVVSALSLYVSLGVLDSAHTRWPDTESSFRWASTLTAFFIAPVAALNASRLSRPGTFTASSAAPHPLGKQLFYSATIFAALISVAVFLGQAPVIVDAIADNGNISLSFIFILLSCCVFFAALAALGSLIAVALARLHPFVVALIALAISYFIAAFTIENQNLWLATPIDSDNPHSLKTTNLFNAVPQLLVALAIAAALLGLLILVSRHWETRGATSRPLGEVTGGVVGILIVVSLIQVLAGKPTEVGENDCTTSNSGTTACVAEADSYALPGIEQDIDQLESRFPHNPDPVQMNETFTLIADESGAQPVETDRRFDLDHKTGRADLTDLAAHMTGYSQCTDPLSDSAAILERLTTHILLRAGVHSRTVEEHGALFQSVTESGEDIAPEDIFANADDETLQRDIADHWDELQSCTVTPDAFANVL